MIDDIPPIETMPPDAIAEALSALAMLCAADNTNYQRDAMRHVGLFKAAREALLKCGIDRTRGDGNPEYIGMFPPSRLSMADSFYLEETHRAAERFKGEFERLYAALVASSAQPEPEVPS